MFKKKKDPLNPDEIPGGGTRSVNNLPIFIAGAVLLIFLSIIAMVAADRSKQAATDSGSQEPGSHSNGASQFATEVAGKFTAGLVPPDLPDRQPEPEPSGQKEKEPTTETVSATTEASPKEPKIDLPATPESEPKDGLFYENIQRVYNTRFQAFEAGLKSRTGVDAEELRNRQSPERVQRDIRTKIEETEQFLATQSSDPTAVYKARLAQLRGETDVEALGIDGGTRGSNNELSRFSRDNTWTLNNSLEAPSSPYLLRAGFVIPAIMLSGINSELPGQVMAQVSQNVYDTATGRFLLIPQGTRLIGTYNNEVAYGQERVLMAWQRLVFPDGKALDIQAMPGADSSGYGGFTDKINNHYWRTFSSAFLLSGVIAAVSLSQEDKDDDSNKQRASDALSEALGQTLGNTMAQMLSKNLNISPTLQIRPGYRFNVMVTKDITFPRPFTRFDY